MPEPISAGGTPDQADGGARGRAWVRANRVEKTASEQGCGRAVGATVMVGVSVRAGRPVLVAGLFGLFNGWLITRFRIQPIIATLVLFIAGRGIASEQSLVEAIEYAEALSRNR